MDQTQRGVAIGAVSALITAIIISGLVLSFAPEWEDSLKLRLGVLAASVLAPALALCISIARLANHRFVTPEEINGSGLTAGGARAKLLQALLQNTLEQLALAVPVYLSCVLIYPTRLLGMVPAAATLFLLGRVFFYLGYAKGAPSRAYGFGLTFYPTVILGGIAIFFLTYRFCS